jgi:putative transposase
MTSRTVQKEYAELSKRYWGKHFWAIGYGALSSGEITDKMIQDYL